MPAVCAAIAKGRPLITGFGECFETEPVACVGGIAAGRGTRLPYLQQRKLH
jgi:hypothetical protein